jgi:hypothetical protein
MSSSEKMKSQQVRTTMKVKNIARGGKLLEEFKAVPAKN